MIEPFREIAIALIGAARALPGRNWLRAEAIIAFNEAATAAAALASIFSRVSVGQAVVWSGDLGDTIPTSLRTWHPSSVWRTLPASTLEAQEAMQNFCKSFSAAAAQTRGCTVDDLAIRFPRDRVTKIAEEWRAVCAMAMRVTYYVDDVVIDDERRRRRNLRLRQTLRRAQEGFAPCVDSEGRVFVPEGPSERREPRDPVQLVASLVTQRGHWVVTVRDLSRTGIGLSECPPLALGQVVEIEMSGGRRLKGAVVWHRWSDAGVRLDVPLDHSDALFRHAGSALSEGTLAQSLTLGAPLPWHPKVDSD